jgi:hypothetical protein
MQVSKNYLVTVLCRLREKMGTFSGNGNINSSKIRRSYLRKFDARANIISTCYHALISVPEQSLNWMSGWQGEKRLERAPQTSHLTCFYQLSPSLQSHRASPFQMMDEMHVLKELVWALN